MGPHLSPLPKSPCLGPMYPHQAQGGPGTEGHAGPPSSSSPMPLSCTSCPPQMCNPGAQPTRFSQMPAGIACPPPLSSEGGRPPKGTLPPRHAGRYVPPIRSGCRVPGQACGCMQDRVPGSRGLTLTDTVLAILLKPELRPALAAVLGHCELHTVVLAAAVAHRTGVDGWGHVEGLR